MSNRTFQIMFSTPWQRFPHNICNLFWPRHSSERTLGCRWTICAQAAASIFANITNQIDAHYSLLLPTEYFALVASSSPSLSQLIIGFGFPWAEQLSRVLPPSFASTYCGGVAVNDGGAANQEEKKSRRSSSQTISTAVQELTSLDQLM